MATLRLYDPAYLAGFKALRYQRDLEKGFDEVQGDRPYSFWKVAGLIFFLLAALATFVLVRRS